MNIFLGLCPDCGMDSGSFYRCRKCRDKRSEKNKRVCKKDGCFNLVNKGKQFCDEHILYKNYHNACMVNFNICKSCGKLFTARKSHNYRCKECWIPEIKKKICAYHLCGKEFFSSNNIKTTCSISCSIKFGDYLAKQKRRAGRSSSLKFKERVVIGVLFKRDNGNCKFCGEKLKLSTHYLNKKAPVIDHIIPLSKGGEHSYKNTQLLCRYCNSVKGSKMVINREQFSLLVS